MFPWLRKPYLVSAAILLVAMGCNQPDGGNKALQTVEDSTTIPISTRQADTIYAGEGDTAVQLKDNEVFIKGHIVANKNQPKYTVPAQNGQTITATIKPIEKGGNVRINQIQQPGGGLDGPFGDSLSYTFKRNGSIGFIIGQNLMAGDPYTGDFILHILLSGK